MKFFLFVLMVLFLNTVSNAQINSNNSQSPELIVHEFLKAVKEKNFDKVATYLNENVKWEQPGDNQFSGLKNNLQEVFIMFKGMLQMSATTLELKEIKTVAVNGNSVACILHWVAYQPTGKTLNVENIDIYEIANGKIISVKVFSVDNLKEDNFWSK